MNDGLFIKNILEKGKEAKEKASHTFSGISLQQLNWKPAPNTWSMGQCLEHLIISDNAYFSTLQKVTDNKYQMNLWEKNSPLSKMFGRILIHQLREQVGIRMKAPKIIQPISSELQMDIIDKYHNSLDKFLHLITGCKDVDLDKTIITSPVTRFVTYSLRDALQFLMQHEHRHLNQAIRVRIQEGFPISVFT